MSQAVILELDVNDHPGVLVHVSGLFARRGFNLDGVLCLPRGDGGARLWLKVRDDASLPQVEAQLAKLHDVRGARRHAPERDMFALAEQSFR